MDWPEGFWWGTATSSTQVEGAALAADWGRWERLGRVPASGDGNGFGHRFTEDFALLAEHGLLHHRLSIEWARLEPEEGRHDTSAVTHYRAVLDAARDAGISVWVTLHHFTLPGWFGDDMAGFGDERSARYRFSRHVDFVAETFGDLVAGWVPINEPVVYATSAFRLGTFPPGRQDEDDFHTVLRTVHRANADAARLLQGGGAPVAAIGEQPDDPELLEPFDLIGVVSYTAEAVDEVLHRVAETHDDTPVLMTFGIGAEDDAVREEALRSVLGQLHAAIADGIDVRGFSYFLPVDAYVWNAGFSTPFGLFDRDRDPRPSLDALKSEIQTGP